jgi:hypothetical protein
VKACQRSTTTALTHCEFIAPIDAFHVALSILQEKRGTRTYAIMGFIGAVLSLFMIPEIFGSAAIILGAYTWRKEKGNLGIFIVILGIIFMIVGIEFTAYLILIDLLPS